MGYDVFCGLDVGKEFHHGTALNRDGDRVADRVVANDETVLRELFDELAGMGEVLVVVDQPSSIGSLPIAVARSMGIDVAYLPGLSMRRLADLHPGNAKTDARDAYIIADAARTLPHTLRQVDLDDEQLAELEVLVGHDDIWQDSPPLCLTGFVACCCKSTLRWNGRSGTTGRIPVSSMCWSALVAQPGCTRQAR